MNVFASTVIAKPVDQIWAVLRQFDALTQWSPVVTKALITNHKSSDQIGAIRHLVLADASEFFETLLSLSDEDHELQYDIINSPLPVSNYCATMRVYPITSTGETFATWSAQFDTSEANQDAMREVVGEQICTGGLAAMKSFFES